MLYFFEKLVFGEPVPIMPNSRLLLIPNETVREDLLKLTGENLGGMPSND